MVKMKKKVYNFVFFAYGLKIQINIDLTIQIISILVTFILLTIAEIFLYNGIKAIIINIIQFDIQNLQQQY